ncbi:MAG: calcium-translocating P-type ATPase, PMCA-type [Anaerovoracaceae bacterium]
MFYNKEKELVIEEFNSSLEGLKSEQVQLNKEQYGENKIEEKKKKSVLQIFLEQFKDLLVVILIIAALISAATGNMESTIVIIAVIVMNSILGTVQYVKAEKSLDSLKKMSSPSAKVIRDGKSIEIPAYELVVGDIIRLEAGDVVPGDGRVLESYSLKINESALTGESESVEKISDKLDAEKVALGDQKNMVFSSSLVTYGRATVIITAVGGHTELGKIAELLDNTAERKTPLQVSMDNFSKKLSILILLICILVMGLSLFRGMAMVDALLFAVALAVAAIPEALSSIITISLAIGTSKMAKQNAIVKKLRAVEGLGCVSVICSDKTGTLTQNKMTVEEVISEDFVKDLLLTTSILCNDTIVNDEGLLGDPTETALVDYYIKNKNDYEDKIIKYARISEIPFDSERKLMSTLHNIEGKTLMLTKGAVDVLTERVKHIVKGDEIIDVTEADIENIKKQNEELSNQGLRVLAFAYKETENISNLELSMEDDYTFIGLIAMMDPPREESAAAVRDCKKAGIKPVMITGDHKITATAIAKKIGLYEEGDRAITGLELDAMSDDELRESIKDISVYARVSPDNKIRIVNMWQELGHVVAMTGDGVNDAPALKQSDIGIAMGITGTEVSKDAASMILTDDNFATIIKAVLNGRNIYANIKNSIKFLLSGNTAGILVVLYASILGLPTPFAAVHLLFINLVTDSLPALAIGMEPSNKELIKDKPRGNDEAILSKNVMLEIILQGFVIGAATIGAFYYGLQEDVTTAMTMAFATLCLARLWHGFNSRGLQSIFKLKFFTNMFVIYAFIVGVLLLSCVLFIPVLMSAFSIATLSVNQIVAIAVLAFVPTLVIQTVKVILDMRRK